MKITDHSTRFGSLLAIILLFSMGLDAFTQDREYIYDHFNISNGLISDMVTKILVDNEGHVWMTTYNGLQKYNGYEFVTYTSNPDQPGTLSSNYVVNIFEDRTGDLIVVLDDGIDIYDKQTDRFDNLVRDVKFRDIRRNEISRRSSALQDRFGSIWVNCNNQVFRIDSLKKEFTGYHDDFNGLYVMNKDSTCFWIITDRVLKQYSIEKNLLIFRSIEDIPAPLPVDRLNTLYYDSKGICWVGTSSGLFVLDEKEVAFLDPLVELTGLDAQNHKILEQEITAIYEDFQSDLWIASGTRMHRIDRRSGKVQLIEHEIENPNSILDEKITGIHGDHKGMIWVTYMNEGITRVNIRTRDFFSYRFRPGMVNSLGGKTVRSVYRDDQGYIWLGLYYDGLDRIHPETGAVSHFINSPEKSYSINSDYISSLLMDRQRRLWVGSHDNGLCFSDNPYQESPRFQVPGFLNENDEIYHMQEDNLGRIWFGTRNGLGVYDHGTGKYHQVLEGHNVQSFVIDGQTIWIATWNYGLCKLIFTGKQFISEVPLFDTLASMYHAPQTAEESLQGLHSSSGEPRNCISIYLDDKKDIWLGTYDMGLVRASAEGEQLSYRMYGTREGAPGNSVYGVLGDGNGHIWISTQHGLGKFNPGKESFENFYREDGLLSDYFMWKSYFKAANGALYFGSVDGLNAFYPDLITKDSLKPRVLFSELRVHNQLVEFGDTLNGDVILKRHISYQDSLVLNHRNRDFAFRCYATGYINPRKLRYAHMLVGYDNNWIISGSENRTVSYINLDPGTYHFRIRSTDHPSDWPYPYVEKTIIILPPWWKTRLAVILYLLIIAGLIFLIINSLVRFLALKQELKYNERLHQSKLIFFTNISHDLKTPLSLIKAPLDDILNEPDLTPHDQRNLQVARENADNLLNLVDELMEFRRTDTGVSKLRAEKLELNSFISDLAAQFECMAEQKGIHFYSHIPEGKQEIWVDRKKFRRIINNLLANAFKYTGEESLVTLSIVQQPERFSFKPGLNTLNVNKGSKHMNYFGILVSDTGLGISRDSLPRIFDRFYQIEAERASQHIGSGIGLALVKNLVLMHSGEIRVASERGVGTEILVLLPMGNKHLRKDEIATNMTDLPLTEHIPESNLVESVSPIERKLSDTPAKPTLLLVEDHLRLREFLRAHLEDEYRILEASNGEKGIKVLEENTPDLIITDWIMPGMDGAEFIRELKTRESTAGIPLILLTAKDEFRDRQKGLELGADQVIPKPFNLQLLKSQVRRTIENNRVRMRKFSMESMDNLVQAREDMEAHFLEQVERSIRDHLQETGLNAAIIAMELGISRTSLYEKIKSISGLTIGEYIQKIRLQHALKLMLYEGLTVSEACIKTGFSSSSYMIRLFRKHYNTTPGEYIRNYTKSASN